jgi:hypothetical protein
MSERAVAAAAILAPHLPASVQPKLLIYCAHQAKGDAFLGAYQQQLDALGCVGTEN